MHPRADHNPFLRFHFLWWVLKISNREHVARVAGERLAEHLALEAEFVPRVQVDFVQVAHDVRVGVRVAVGQVDGVVVAVELDAKCQRVVMEGAFALHGVGVVADVFATANPSAIVALGVDLGVEQRFHSVVVEAVGLKQVDYIESVQLVCPRVLDHEVEPLSLPLGVVVRSQDQIVFVVVDLYRSF